MNRVCAAGSRAPRTAPGGRVLDLLVALALVLPGVARAADPLAVPIASGARKPVALPAGDQIQLSLEQAIRLALENSLDLNVASLSYEKSDFGIGSAQGIFDPNAEIDVGASRDQTPSTSRFNAPDAKTQYGNAILSGLVPTGGSYKLNWDNTRSDSVVPGFTLINPTYGSKLTVAASQPLLKNFGTTVTNRFIVQAKYGRDTSAWSFVVAVQTGIQLVENAYWDLAYSRALLVARKEALDRAKDLNRITKIKIDVGTLAPIDIVQTEVTVAQREQDIITAEGLIGDAEDRLKRLLNVRDIPDWQRPILTTDLPKQEPMTVSLEEGMKKALETRPEIRQNLIDIESKKLTLAYSRNQLLPRLDLSASYGLAGVGAKGDVTNPDGTIQSLSYSDALTDITRRDFPAWTVGAVFAIPIFNRTARNNAALAASDLELSRTNLVLLKQNLWVEVRGAARGIDTALRSIDAAKKSSELAERNLDAEKKKYENGMTTSFQVSQIQNDLSNAQATELQSYATYLKARVAWHKAIGDILDWKGVTLEGVPVSMSPISAEEFAAK